MNIHVVVSYNTISHDSVLICFGFIIKHSFKLIVISVDMIDPAVGNRLRILNKSKLI